MYTVMAADVVNLLERQVYGMAQVDRILGLRSGTSRRWIDGYSRAGKQYAPVVRELRTGDESVTWGEFVETRLLSEYRDAGVPLIRMRPAIEALREELDTPYPLASAQTWLDVEGQELVKKVQDAVSLDRQLALVELRTGQALIWAKPADDFQKSIEWTDANGQPPHPRLLRPYQDIAEVKVDPLRGFGEPVVRAVRTDAIAELIRAGDSQAMVGELYELEPREVEAALQYELRRAA